MESGEKSTGRLPKSGSSWPFSTTYLPFYPHQEKRNEEGTKTHRQRERYLHQETLTRGPPVGEDVEVESDPKNLWERRDRESRDPHHYERYPPETHRIVESKNRVREDVGQDPGKYPERSELDRPPLKKKVLWRWVCSKILKCNSTPLKPYGVEI